MGTTSSSPDDYDNDYELVIRWSKELEHSLRSANIFSSRPSRRRRSNQHRRENNEELVNTQHSIEEELQQQPELQQQEGLMELIRHAQRFFRAATIRDMRELAKLRNRLVHDHQCHRIPDDDRYFLEESYGRVALEMREIVQRRGFTRGHSHDNNHNNRRTIITEEYDWYGQYDDDDHDENDHDEDDDNNLHRLALLHHHHENDFETVISASKELEHDLRAHVLGWEDNYNAEASTRPSLLDMIQLVQRRRLFRSEIIHDMYRFLKVRNKLVHDYGYNQLSPRDRSIFVETQQRLAVEMQPFRMQQPTGRSSSNSRRRHEPTEHCHFAFFACIQVAPESTAITTKTTASPRQNMLHTRTPIQSTAVTTTTGRISTKVRLWLVAAGLLKPNHDHQQQPQVLAQRDFCGCYYMGRILAVGVLVFSIAIRYYQATAVMAVVLAMVVVTLGRGMMIVWVYAPVLCARRHRAWLHVTHQGFGCDVCGKPVAKDRFLYGCQTCNWDACQSCAKRFVLAAKHRSQPMKHYYA